jgi:plasmid stabilization system protein ParE
MSRSICFTLAAESDPEQAANWYDGEQLAVGTEFLEVAYRTFDLIADHPQIFANVFQKTRQAILRRFPYAVYFVMESERIVVYPLIHSARDPSIWQSRIPSNP